MSGQLGRFLIFYSVPPTSHLSQLPSGTLVQQSSLLGGTVDPQLGINGTQVIQTTPTSSLNYATMSQPFLVQGNQPHIASGTTLLPTIGNSLFNGMFLVQPNTSGSLVCGHVPENSETSSKASSSPVAVSPGSNPKPTATTDNDKNRHIQHPPPPPPLLQLNPQVRASPTADSTKVSILSPPLSTTQASLFPSPIGQPQVANCIQRLVILGDMGKSQSATMLLPAPGESEQNKQYSVGHMVYDPHQVVSSIPFYRFGSSHPIQFLTPVGASAKKS